jgi:Polyketide cyclase / dehydrase and lipid transport
LKTRWAIAKSRFIPTHAPALIERLITPASWPQWQPEIVSVDGPRRLCSGDVVLGEARMLGFDVDGRAQIRALEPNAVEHEVVVGIHMRVRYEVAPAEGGTVLHHHLIADLPGGVCGRILSVFLRRRLKWMQQVALDNLANWDGIGRPSTTVDTGEIPLPESDGRHRRQADP